MYDEPRDRGNDAPDEQSEPETYDALTWLEATNADTQLLVAGRQGPQRLLAEEIVDGTAARVQRDYEVRAVIDLPEPMPNDAIVDWVNDHRDDERFDGYDWQAHDTRELLQALVEQREWAFSVLQHFERELDELSVVGVEAQQQIEELRDDLAEMMLDIPQRAVDRTDDEDGEPA